MRYVKLKGIKSYITDFDIEGHKLLFEDLKREDSVNQIFFVGHPFIILGKKFMDCTHGVDHCVSTKKKLLEKKIKVVCYKYLIFFQIYSENFIKRFLCDYWTTKSYINQHFFTRLSTVIIFLLNISLLLPLTKVVKMIIFL